MALAIKILTPLVFIAAVIGLTYMLSTSSKKDADRWLVDRRVVQRRKHDSGVPVDMAERRTIERRQPEKPGSRI
ncbi:MAG: hypothetical protein IID09_01575 [Candidatus Hydrogenedentes bacterium]|nr:hypothetical protein [Candidatus Hydrogenedentota bacterium]